MLRVVFFNIHNIFCIQQEKLKLYIEGKDDVPGSRFYSGFIDALEKSRKIIVVLSNSFLKSARCLGHVDLAGKLNC